VVALVRRLYPDRPGLLLPFAFAVFAAAGVAPFVTSNPMNTVVAHAAGIGFNEYAVRMVPVALVSSAMTFVVLRALFAAELRAAPAPVRAPETGGTWSGPQRQALALVLGVLAAYPVFALAGLEVYVVAAAGAALALALARRHRAGAPVEILRTAIAWEILAFLFGMFLLARGLQNVGVVDRLADLYEGAGGELVGVVSALGSALVNNHSMALTNLLAIEAVGGDKELFLAALVGGDLGPRLLPVGSLAGLLWLALLQRLGVGVPLRRFVAIGAAVTVPSLAVSLLVLAAF
jgi:arsenical pump membrane protein